MDRGNGNGLQQLPRPRPATPLRFRLTFELPAGFLGAQLTGSVLADETVRVRLNNNFLIGPAVPAGSHFTIPPPPLTFNVTDQSRFVAGTNTLESSSSTPAWAASIPPAWTRGELRYCPGGFLEICKPTGPPSACSTSRSPVARERSGCRWAPAGSAPSVAAPAVAAGDADVVDESVEPGAEASDRAEEVPDRNAERQAALAERRAERAQRNRGD